MLDCPSIALVSTAEINVLALAITLATSPSFETCVAVRLNPNDEAALVSDELIFVALVKMVLISVTATPFIPFLSIDATA